MDSLGLWGPEHAPFDDALTAAVDMSVDLIVATRSTRHFEPLRVSYINPWEADPPTTR